MDRICIMEDIMASDLEKDIKKTLWQKLIDAGVLLFEVEVKDNKEQDILLTLTLIVRKAPSVLGHGLNLGTTKK
jgi:hypothetical protein